MLSKLNLQSIEAAKEYLDQGLVSIPVPLQRKKPNIKGWPSITKEDCLSRFTKKKTNIGILWGSKSNNIIDIDLDCPEAIAIAPLILPPTQTYGRNSSPQSHYIYKILDECGKRETFKDENRKMLLEYRGNGYQSLVEPSLHPSGEPYQWDRNGLNVLEIRQEELMAFCNRLASIVLITQTIPHEGSRQNYWLAVSGYLVRSGISEERIREIIDIGARYAQDEEYHARQNTLDCTIQKHGRGEQISGRKALLEFMSAKRIQRLNDMMGISSYPVRTNLIQSTEQVEYVEDNGGFALCKNRKTIPISNFTAKYISETIIDFGDSSSCQKRTVQALFADKTYTFTIDPVDFTKLNWVERDLPANAIVYPGRNNKDHLITAIKLRSTDIETKYVYGQLGWRIIDDEYHYLHAAGSISKHGSNTKIEVALPDNLKRFSIKKADGFAEEKRAIECSFELLELAKDELMIPLLAAVYRAPIGNITATIQLTGESGGGKTTIASLCQQHYGESMGVSNLPGNWSSTPNATEELLHIAKDTLTVVDDFAPDGDSEKRLQYFSARLFRNNGNDAGRQRMDGNFNLLPSRSPKALLLSTGEDIPKGESINARFLSLDMDKSTLCWEKVTEAQSHTEKYSQAMFSYISWLAPQMPSLTNDIVQLRQENRKHFKEAAHPRYADQAADLFLGWTFLLQFASDHGIINQAEQEELREKGLQAFRSVVKAQEYRMDITAPEDLFFAMLQTALSDKAAYVTDQKGNPPLFPQDYNSLENAKGPSAWGWRNDNGNWNPHSKCIGFVDGDDLFLLPKAAYSIARKMAAEQGTPLTISKTSLWKRLNAKRLLLSKEVSSRHLTIRQSYKGIRKNFIHVASNLLVEIAPEELDPDSEAHMAHKAHILNP